MLTFFGVWILFLFLLCGGWELAFDLGGGMLGVLFDLPATLLFVLLIVLWVAGMLLLFPLLDRIVSKHYGVQQFARTIGGIITQGFGMAIGLIFWMIGALSLDFRFMLAALGIAVLTALLLLLQLNSYYKKYQKHGFPLKKRRRK